MASFPAAEQQSFRLRLSGHALDLLRLAMPVIVARIGIITMALIDTIMIGQYSAGELAVYGLSSPVVGVMIGIGVGLVLGTPVMASHALGQGNDREVGAVWWRSLPYALLIGAAGGGLCLLAEPFFRATGQEPDLAVRGAEVLYVLALSMPGAMLFMVASMFLEALKRPLPGMLASFLANAMNVALNWVFVFGNAGFPALGAVGAAWTTTIVRWVTALLLLAYIWFMRDQSRYAIRRPPPGLWRGASYQRRLGYAAGISIGLENSAFLVLTLFAGWLGELALGAFTIGMHLMAVPFMAAVGMATATGVRVGHAYGRRDRSDVAFAGWTGLGVTSVIMAGVGVAFALFPMTIADWFNDDERLLVPAAAVVAFSAWILVADGGQNVLALALRARSDTWIPTILHFISYYAIMIPVSVFFAFTLKHGMMGLLEGILVASLVSVSVLAGRFAWLNRRDRGMQLET